MKLRAARHDEVAAFVAQTGPLAAPREHVERAQRAGELLLAYDGEQLHGGVIAAPCESTLYVSALVTAVRSGGNAAGLLDALAAHARERRIARLRLDCPTANETLARELQAYGFYPRGLTEHGGVRVLRLDRTLRYEVPAERFAADRWATLLFVVAGGQVLLIRKQRGHGAGKINAPGGMVEQGESFAACALRETAEEVGVHVDHATPLAQLQFRDRDGSNLLGLAFKAERYRGTPAQTAEAIPFWCPLEQLPFEEMWADDILWLPWLLDDSPVSGDFYMDNDALLAHRLRPTTLNALQRLAAQRR